MVRKSLLYFQIAFAVCRVATGVLVTGWPTWAKVFPVVSFKRDIWMPHRCLFELAAPWSRMGPSGCDTIITFISAKESTIVCFKGDFARFSAVVLKELSSSVLRCLINCNTAITRNSSKVVITDLIIPHGRLTY